MVDSSPLLRAAPRLNFGCTNPSPDGDNKNGFALISTRAGHLMKRAAATAWLVSPHNTEEHLRLGCTARMDWVMSPSPGDALVC
ncbi:hypothetical protein, partial [Enterobacter sp.]|uniref:hypothetical protein n=1 Tax=Enterobacter sp. TaxID=42895 RepID=UPI00296FAC43